MSFDALSPGGLDYLPCRYSSSKALFRGPRRSLDAPYIAFFGGTTTYGKYISSPFPDLVEAELGQTCVNLGSLNGGIDVYAVDPVLREIASAARVTVIQITSPRNISNRFYQVHPRRNDRFVQASSLLRAIYREVDFAEFNFTNHLLHRLHQISPKRFEAVVKELQAAWLARMRLTLNQIPGKTFLLWAGKAAPPKKAVNIDCDPAFVTRDMVNRIRPLVTEVVEVVASQEALSDGTEGMVFTAMDAPAAQTMMGPQMHREIADALLPRLRSILLS